MKFLGDLHDCDVLVLDDFLTTPFNPETASELLDILAGRERRGATMTNPGPSQTLLLQASGREAGVFLQVADHGQ